MGRSGKLLDRLMAEELGIDRSACYIANVVKCRPPDNRDPRPDEIAACRPTSTPRSSSSQPTVVVTLGNFATKLLLDTTDGIRRSGDGRTRSARVTWSRPTTRPPPCGRAARWWPRCGPTWSGPSGCSAGRRDRRVTRCGGALPAPPPSTRPARWPAAVAGLCVPGDVVLLAGDLGAGKTDLRPGLRAGPRGRRSPSPARPSPWSASTRVGRRAGPDLLHADVYRLDHLREIVDLGLGELVEDGGVAAGRVG